MPSKAGHSAQVGERPDYDVVIVGAGVGGLYAIRRLRELGFTVRAFEAGSGVGGTWFWNRYPGARCDVESVQYSYSFSEELQQEWNWTEKFGSQPEILAYIRHVAERYDLLKDVQLDTRISSATYDEDGRQWVLTTDGGEEISGRFCLMATGNLSAPRISPLPKQEQFAGQVFYTAQWPEEGVDLTGLVVGVVGTGASGTQSIPHIAAQAKHLTVFQRTANYSVPSWNGPMTPERQAEWKANYAALRKKQVGTKGGIIFETNSESALEVTPERRVSVFERFWKLGGLNFMQSFSDLGTNRAANETAAEFVRSKIRATVGDPATAESLIPKTHAIGMKRICTDTGYYETFNRANVTLVDVREHPILEVTAGGIRTTTAEYPLDVIVMATGFEAMTGALARIDISGRNGLTLRERWTDGPTNYLGLAVSGFPNLFTLTGPHSPSTLVSLILGNEQHVDWVGDCLVGMREHGLTEIEANQAAEDDWVAHSQQVASANLKYHAPESGYIYKGPTGKRTFMVYLGGFEAYRAICDDVARDGYRGFSFAPATPASEATSRISSRK